MQGNIWFIIQSSKRSGNKFSGKTLPRAFESLLIENRIPYKKEFLIEVSYNNKSLGKFFVDFVVWNKIIIELKTTNLLIKDHLKQVLRYLETTDIRLGLIVNFRQRPLKPMRVLNSKVAYSHDSQAKSLA